MFDTSIPTSVSVPTSDGPRRLLVDPPARIMSRADCEVLFKRVVGMATGGGDTSVKIRCTWTSNLRWARNHPTTSGDTSEYTVVITRAMPGKTISAGLQKLDDVTLKETVHMLDTRLAEMDTDENNPPLEMLSKQKYLSASIWSDLTYQMKAKDLSDAARMSVDPVVDAKLDAAGYAELSAISWAVFNTRGMDAYAAATGALYTETVRSQDGIASGWTGKTHMDWAKLDVKTLSTVALQKCRDSANPVKVEPGRYTTILEANSTGTMIYPAIHAMNRYNAETDTEDPYYLRPNASKIGQPVFDSRITITSDPTDLECGYLPFDPSGNPYRKVNWVENGILKELPYDRVYARQNLNTDVALPNPLAFRMSGGTTSVSEMIASTERGIYVTGFGRMSQDDPHTLNTVGVTRNGLWLIEHGKITHAIKNLWINDSPLVVFNQVEQLGPPVRVFGIQTWGWFGAERDLPSQALNDGHTPVVVPPVKVKDFNFTRIADAT